MTVVLEGIGAWLPPEIVTNLDVCANIDTSPEWIEGRTGIIERRVAGKGMATAELAVAAGRKAMKSAARSSVDAVVVATTSPDRICPAAAPEVAFRLGLPDVAAFDLTSACSGFVYGLVTATGLIASGVADSVLLIGAEAFTNFVNPQDRATAPIFGDGAGAVVLRRGSAQEAGALGAFDLGSDGSRADLLAIPGGGSRQRSSSGLGHMTVPVEDWYLKMEGRPLFVQAVRRMAQSARTVLARAGWSVSEVDWFVGHQANIRIVRAVSDELGVPGERVAVNIDRVGNALAASIPILLTDMADRGDLKPGHRVLLTAFGAGLSWGSAALTWPAIETDGSQ
jgi:3-oxoacyl-[acyl-carrier-protein] synthase-3